MQSVIVPKIKSTKDKVIRIMSSVNNSKCKDNDERLVAVFWWNEIHDKKLSLNPNGLTIVDFLQMYSEGKLTSADIITRARRKAQEENPELRGTKWKERHNEEKLVRDEINDKLPKHCGGYTP